MSLSLYGLIKLDLLQAYDEADIDPSTGETLDVGQRLDAQGSPKKNDGFFEKAVLSAHESEDGIGREVKVIGNGHSHCEILPFCFRRHIELVSFYQYQMTAAESEVYGCVSVEEGKSVIFSPVPLF